MPSGPHRIDCCVLSDGKFVDIQGLSREVKVSKLNGHDSGRATLKIKGASINDDAIRVPAGAKLEVAMTDRFTNGRYLSAGGRSLRAVNNKKVFVIRADAPDASTGSTMAEISDEVFGTGTDIVILKSQFAACSYDQLTFEAVDNVNFNGHVISNGVGEVTLNDPVAGLSHSAVRIAMLN